jgi:prepilin-type N-terminal cleavage/methylation domain-containing protein
LKIETVVKDEHSGEGKMDDQNGFTLVETLVTVAIVSVLSVIALPPLRAWCQGAGFRSEVSMLVGSLHTAKMEAAKTNSFVVVAADPDGYLIFVDNSPVPGEAGDWIRQSDERLLVDCRLRNGVTLATNFSIKKDKVRFHSCRPGITAGRFILTDAGGRRMDVVLSAVGRIRVE